MTTEEARAVLAGERVGDAEATGFAALAFLAVLYVLTEMGRKRLGA